MRAVGELAGDAGLVGAHGRGQRIEVGHVDALRGGVGRRQDDVGVAFAQRADRMRALVEHVEIVLRRVAVADAVEDVQEGLVALAEDLLEFEQRHAGAFAQRRHLEEERPAVLVLEMLGDLALHDRRQLMQIAEQQQPDAAERLARPAAIDAQRLVDRPHQVGAHHRHLVDDDAASACA